MSLNALERQTFPAGTSIIKLGDKAHAAYVVDSGKVEIWIERDGGKRVLSEVTTGGIFGEMALIDSEPRSATVTAITDVELVPVSEKQFLFLVSQTPYFALKVMRVLAQRLRVTNKTFG